MRKLLILSALTAMALLSGACGSSEDEGSSAEKTPEKAERPTAVETVRVAYRETAAEQTARTSFEVTSTGPPAGLENDGREAEPMTFTMRGQGVKDFSGAPARRDHGRLEAALRSAANRAVALPPTSTRTGTFY